MPPLRVLSYARPAEKIHYKLYVSWHVMAAAALNLAVGIVGFALTESSWGWFLEFPMILALFVLQFLVFTLPMTIYIIRRWSVAFGWRIGLSLVLSSGTFATAFTWWYRWTHLHGC